MRRLSRQTRLPDLEPIAPVLRDQPFDGPEGLFEPKYDGFRGMPYLTRHGCTFRSKRGNVLKQFDALGAQVRRQLSVDDAILDGEVIALDAEGRQDFRALLSRRGDLHYAVFDVLWLNGKNRTTLRLTRRRRMLERLIPVTTQTLSRVFAAEARGRDLFRAAEQLDLEGIVAKRKADQYTPDTVWYKIKNRAYTQTEGRGELFHPKPR